MIKEITIKNVRPHKSLVLKDLHPNLNVIIGDTGTGKTSIFRALRLLFNNEPSAGAKLYKLKEKTEILIKAIVKKYMISRTAKKYKLNDSIMSAFGRTVPEPIKEIIDLKDINWQLQTQPHFLILDNGGTIAKYLNPILGSEDTDLILDKLKELTSNLKTDIKVVGQNIKEYEKVVFNNQNIKSHKKKVDNLQEHLHSLQGLDRLIFSLMEKINSVSKLENKIVDQRKLKLFIDVINDLELLTKKQEKLDSKIQKLKNQLTKLKSLKHISVKGYIEQVDEICNKIEQKSSLQNTIDKLQSLLNSYETIDEELIKGKKEQKELEAEWRDIFSSLDICPFCNRKMEKTDARNHLHNGYSHSRKKSTLQIR
jgi:DNA repair exonuclease SbcCD ATPase subunit